jgi:hypothetical protein
MFHVSERLGTWGFGFESKDIPELFDGWTYLGKL